MSDPTRGALLALHISATPGHVDVETPALRDATGRVWKWFPLDGWFHPDLAFVSPRTAATFRAGTGHGWWCTAWDERVGDWRCSECDEHAAAIRKRKPYDQERSAS